MAGKWCQKNVLFQPSSPRHPIEWKFGKVRGEKVLINTIMRMELGIKVVWADNSSSRGKLNIKLRFLLFAFWLSSISPPAALLGKILCILHSWRRGIFGKFYVSSSHFPIFLSATTQAEIDSVLIVNLYFYYQTEAEMMLQQQHQRVPFVMSWHNISLKILWREIGGENRVSISNAKQIRKRREK